MASGLLNGMGRAGGVQRSLALFEYVYGVVYDMCVCVCVVCNVR